MRLTVFPNRCTPSKGGGGLLCNAHGGSAARLARGQVLSEAISSIHMFTWPARPWQGGWRQIRPLWEMLEGVVGGVA